MAIVRAFEDNELRRALTALGMTWDELEWEARTGRFSSDRAAETWATLADQAPTGLARFVRPANPNP